MTTMSKPGKNTSVIKEGWFYAATFFRGEYGDAHRPPERRSEKCSLFVTRAQLRRGPSGKVRAVTDRDLLDFENEDGMLAWIEDHDAEELPSEADGNPLFVPEGFRASGGDG